MPQSQLFAACLAFSLDERVAARRGVRIDTKAGTAPAQHFLIQPEARALGIDRLDVRQRAIVPVACQARIVEANFPPHDHIFQHSGRVFCERVRVIVTPVHRRRFKADETHALSGIKDQRVAIDDTHHAAALPRLHLR